MKKIAIVGPESSGKTSLAESLARHYDCRYAMEFARYYLNDLQRPYNEDDLVAMSKGQIFNELLVTKQDLVICDTDLLTFKIWSLDKYETVDSEILEAIACTNYDFTFLMKPDFPWEYDPLRENPHDRDRLFEVFEMELQKYNRDYCVLSGSLSLRLNKAIRIIDGLLGDQSQINS